MRSPFSSCGAHERILHPRPFVLVCILKAAIAQFEPGVAKAAVFADERLGPAEAGDAVDGAFGDIVRGLGGVSDGIEQAGREHVGVHLRAELDRPRGAARVANVHLGIGSPEILFHKGERRKRHSLFSTGTPGPVRGAHGVWRAPEYEVARGYRLNRCREGTEAGYNKTDDKKADHTLSPVKDAFQVGPEFAENIGAEVRRHGESETAGGVAGIGRAGRLPGARDKGRAGSATDARVRDRALAIVAPGQKGACDGILRAAPDARSRPMLKYRSS